MPKLQILFSYFFLLIVLVTASSRLLTQDTEETLGKGITSACYQWIDPATGHATNITCLTEPQTMVYLMVYDPIHQNVYSPTFTIDPNTLEMFFGMDVLNLQTLKREAGYWPEGHALTLIAYNEADQMIYGLFSKVWLADYSVFGRMDPLKRTFAELAHLNTTVWSADCYVNRTGGSNTAKAFIDPVTNRVLINHNSNFTAMDMATGEREEIEIKGTGLHECWPIGEPVYDPVSGLVLSIARWKAGLNPGVINLETRTIVPLPLFGQLNDTYYSMDAALDVKARKWYALIQPFDSYAYPNPGYLVTIDISKQNPRSWVLERNVTVSTTLGNLLVVDFAK